MRGLSAYKSLSIAVQPYNTGGTYERQEEVRKTRTEEAGDIENEVYASSCFTYLTIIIYIIILVGLFFVILMFESAALMPHFLHIHISLIVLDFTWY